MQQSLKHPILLVHGMGFRDNKHLNYWGRIPKALEAMGCRIYYGNQDSNGTVETNGAVLKERIEQIFAESGAEKLNVIAHSKGGLDMRYVISSLQMGDKIASLTTVSTPHHGSKTVDLLLKLPDILVKIVGKCTDLCLRIGGDKEPDSYKVFHSFSTSYAEKFNQKNPDVQGVYYQSYAFVMKRATSDIFMWFPSLVVSLVEGKNDGLLTPEAVKWGEFQGIYTGASNRGISHCDEVDMRRRRFTKKQGEGISDIVEFYQKLVENLQQQGF